MGRPQPHGDRPPRSTKLGDPLSYWVISEDSRHRELKDLKSSGDGPEAESRGSGAWMVARGDENSVVPHRNGQPSFFFHAARSCPTLLRESRALSLSLLSRGLVALLFSPPARLLSPSRPPPEALLSLCCSRPARLFTHAWDDDDDDADRSPLQRALSERSLLFRPCCGMSGGKKFCCPKFLLGR